MANNYTQFSEGIGRITHEERAWIEHQLDLGNFTGGTAPEWEAPVGDDCLGFEWSLDEGPPFGRLAKGESYFWAYAEEVGDPVHVAEFVRAFLARFRPDDHFSLTYSDNCSQPRVGEFSGGAIFVTKDRWRHFCAYEWVDHQVKEFDFFRVISMPIGETPNRIDNGTGSDVDARPAADVSTGAGSRIADGFAGPVAIVRDLIVEFWKHLESTRSGTLKRLSRLLKDRSPR